MKSLYLCEVELRSLADLEKFGIITSDHIKCQNISEIEDKTCIMDIRCNGYVSEKVVVGYDALTELKKWFYVHNVKEAVCLDGILYIKI